MALRMPGWVRSGASCPAKGSTITVESRWQITAFPKPESTEDIDMVRVAGS